MYSKSIMQMLRSPIKTLLLFLLAILTSGFFTIGANIFIISSAQLKNFEKNFRTIGTIEQVPDTFETDTHSNPFSGETMVYQYPIFSYLVKPEDLHSPDIEYIHKPKRYPYYGAYMEEYNVNSNLFSSPQVIEVTALESGNPFKQPIEVKLVNQLLGDILYSDVFKLQGDQYNDLEQEMLAGKTYILCLNSRLTHYRQPDKNTQIIVQTTLSGYQYDADGNIKERDSKWSLNWSEVTESFYETEAGKRWLNFVQAYEMLHKTVPVMPTDSTDLLLAFYMGNANIYEGQDISEKEYKNGANVCLVESTFAQINSLKIGDTIDLGLYFSNYQDPSNYGFGTNYTQTQPPFSILNNKGETFETFSKNTHTIVGLYSQRPIESFEKGHELGAQAIVIPAESVRESDEDNIVAFGPIKSTTTVFEIPNGSRDAFFQKISELGLEHININIYDKGYAKLHNNIVNMRMFAISIAIISFFLSVSLIVFFGYMFIFLQKKRTAIERSLGVSKFNCAVSLLFGFLLIVFIGYILGSGAGILLQQVIMQAIISGSEKTSFSLKYSSWVNKADIMAEINMPGLSAGTPYWVALICLLVLFSFSMAISIFFIRLNTKKEVLLM